MTTVHIYRERDQPATCWHDYHSGKRMTFRVPANRLLWCWHCNKRRPAKNLVVHAYYDCTMFFCAIGKGCRGKREIEAKRRKLFKARSEGQKRRWQKENS